MKSEWQRTTKDRKWIMSTSIFRVDEIMIFLNESPFVYNLGNSRTIRRLWGNYLRTFFGGLVFLREKGCVFMLSDGGFSMWCLLFARVSWSSHRRPPKQILRQRSHLVPGDGARVRFSLVTNVNAPFFQVPTLEFGHGAGVRIQGLDLVLGHKSGHRVPVCTQFL